MEILDSQKRRAQNLIWNAAGDYSFEPTFKAYDQNGMADLYWNSIIGAVRKSCGAEPLKALFDSFEGCVDQHLYEQLIWIGLENAVFQQEAPCRPALPALRHRYALNVVELAQRLKRDTIIDILEEAHFLRVLGQEPKLSSSELALLNALEFSPEYHGQALVEHAQAFLHDQFGFVPGQAQDSEMAELKKKRFFFPGIRRKTKADLPAVRGFGYGFGEHTPAEETRKESGPPQRRIADFTVAQSEEALRTYIRDFFGPPLYTSTEMAKLQEELCTGDHKNCKLYYAQGVDTIDRTIRGYAGSQRKAALKQMKKNREAYDADLVRHRASIVRLTDRIRNAMMAYLQPTRIRCASGALDPGILWRGLQLDDDKVFHKEVNTDPGDISVDLLLDGSTSQLNRQEIVAAQGYMIAESLTRCGIPVRVSSFCSLSGYTILTRYRDYFETNQNERIFHYFTTGCNRDGLAIKALGRELQDSPCEHKLVILLSDAKPNDVVKIVRDGFMDYADDNGIHNTAQEVRSLIYQNINVICVFTGDDEDIPAAHTIYGRSFARIRSLEQFADTVGTLIQNQIRSLG